MTDSLNIIFGNCNVIPGPIS